MSDNTVKGWVDDFLATKRADTAATPRAPVYFNFYDYPLQDEKGRVDRQYRIDKIEGDTSTIYYERNTRGLALMEVSRLKDAGFTVHAILTPEDMSIEGQERARQELRARWLKAHGAEDLID